MANEGRQGLGAPIYVLANQGNSFAETLANAVGFQFDEHISFRFFVSLLTRTNSMPLRDDSNRLSRVLNAIEKSAFFYMQLHGRPAVIVIDSVDWLQKYMPAVVDHLVVSNSALNSACTWLMVSNDWRIQIVGCFSTTLSFPDNTFVWLIFQE